MKFNEEEGKICIAFYRTRGFYWNYFLVRIKNFESFDPAWRWNILGNFVEYKT